MTTSIAKPAKIRTEADARAYLKDVESLGVSLIADLKAIKASKREVDLVMRVYREQA